MKNYVYSARTTEKGLAILNKLKGTGAWDEFVNTAVAAHYGIPIAKLTLPPNPETEARRKAAADKKTAKAATAKERETSKKAKDAEKKKVADKKAKDKDKADKKASDAKAKADAKAETVTTDPEEPSLCPGDPAYTEAASTDPESDG